MGNQLVPLKRMGSQLTHHSGLIPPLRWRDLYPYRRVSSKRLSPSIIYKSEVIDKGNVKATRKICYEKEKKIESFSSMTYELS